MNIKSIFLIAVCIPLFQLLPAQELELMIEQQRAGKGDSVQVCFAVSNFDNIISIQYTVEWDTSILQFLQAADYGLEGLSEANFGPQLSAEGKLTFVWFNPNGGGSTLADGSLIYCLYFIAVGELGEVSPIGLGNTPTPIEVGILDGQSINAIDLNLSEGEVEIVESVLQVHDTMTTNNGFGEQNGAIQLDFSGGIPPYQFQWNGPGGFSSAESSLSGLESGEYALIVRDSLGRSIEQSYRVAGPESPLNILNTTISPSNCIENTGSIQITANGGTAPYLYDIGNRSNNSGSFPNLEANTYLIMITDSLGCMTDTTVNVPIDNPGQEADLGDDLVLCPGDSTILSSNINGSFNWFRNGVPQANGNNSLLVQQAGTYRLEVTSDSGCRSSDEVEVSFSTLRGFASGDADIERGDSTQLNATEGLAYQWSPSGSLSCSNCANPMASPNDTTTYFVSITTNDGCIFEDSVRVNVSIPEDELRLTPVSLISPNGDGKNDQLFFEGLETYRSNEIKIFSRWGQIVYSKIDYQISGELWDGTLRGKPLPAGIYYYILRVDEQDIQIKRSLTIVRD